MLLIVAAHANRRRAQRCLVTTGVVILASLCLAAGLAAAADDSASFVLRHASAEKLGPQVQSILADLAPGSQVLVDRNANRLVVQGPNETTRLAAQLIQTLDQPDAASANGRRATEAAAVQGYRVPPEELESLHAELRRQFASNSDVRIAVDSRTGQLLVMAPPSVQSQISQLIAQRHTAAPSAALPAMDAPGQEDQRVVHALRHITWRGLEDGLAQILGGREQIITSRNGELATIQLSEQGAGGVQLQIDRRRDQVQLEGAEHRVQLWRRVVEALDRPVAPSNVATQLIRLQRADPTTVQRAISVVQSSGDAARQGRFTAAVPVGAAANWDGTFVARIFQPGEGGAAAPAGPPPAPAQGEAPQAAPSDGERPAGLLGDVQIEFVPELNVLIIRGRPEDVRRVEELIAEIERQSITTRPEIEVYQLQNVNSAALAELITPIYAEVFLPRQGPLSITSLVKPNALLLIGRLENIDALKELIVKLDVPLLPDMQLKVFPLRFMSAVDAEARLTTFFTTPTGLDTRVKVVGDYRSNSLIVQASERDLAEVERLIRQLDVETIEAVTQLRVFPLRNTIAADLQTVLEQAIAGQAQAGQTQTSLPSTRVEILGVDDRGNKIIESGVLSDVAIAADASLNALIVRAPAKSMELIAQLIEQLDRLPEAESQIKVFQIQYGDATNLASMLQQLFGQQVTVGAQGTLNTFGSAFGLGQPAGATGAGTGESSLIPLRFAVEQRTNSIIASGSRGDLSVVEAIIVRLDEGDLRQRKSTVYRLNNAPAQNVATALNNILTRETQLLQQQQQQLFALISPYELIDQQVFVEPELVSNSLIVSATPDYFDQVIAVIEDLDRRPPMVMVHVIIAEVELSDNQELGVELGLQDSLLFDRSVTTAGELDPGFNFINQPLGNSSSAESLATRGQLAGQAFGSFLVGTSSAASGFPGLLLTASNESINVLIRALEEKGRAQVLSRPTIMALNNFPASVLVGERVPRVTDISTTNTGTLSGTELVDTGLSLGIIPRVTPDGVIVMDLEVSKSSVGPVQDGIPIGTSDGVPILSPKFRDTTAITTVSARSGQTVVFAGLITDDKAVSYRGVPFLSSIPVVGRLFRFDTNSEERRELVIFLTPYIVDNENDVNFINVKESQRMSWCLADVLEMAEPGGGLTGGSSIWSAEQAPVIFPDQDPFAASAEPTPAGVPELQLPGPQPALTPRGETRQSKPFFTPAESGRESRPFFDSANPPSVQPPAAGGAPAEGAALLGPPRPLPQAARLMPPGGGLSPSAPPTTPPRQTDAAVTPARFQQPVAPATGDDQQPLTRLPRPE